MARCDWLRIDGDRSRGRGLCAEPQHVIGRAGAHTTDLPTLSGGLKTLGILPAKASGYCRNIVYRLPSVSPVEAAA